MDIFELSEEQKEELQRLDKKLNKGFILEQYEVDRINDLDYIEFKLNKLKEIYKKINDSSIVNDRCINICLDIIYENTNEYLKGRLENYYNESNIYDLDYLENYIKQFTKKNDLEILYRLVCDIKDIDREYFSLDKDGFIRNVEPEDLKDLIENFATTLKDSID